MSDYLFEFTPLNSFVFGSNTALRTPGSDNNGFFSKDKYAQQRQSFYQQTEALPLQTSLMGAVRLAVLKRFGMDDWGCDKTEVARLVGAKSFDLNAPEKGALGIIERISAVFITGEDAARQKALCVPAPRDCGMDKENGSRLVLMASDAFNAKDERKSAFLAYPLTGEGQPTYVSADRLYTRFDQPAYQVPAQGSPEHGMGNFHMQQRCRLLDRRLDSRELPDAQKAYLSRPAFAIWVTLKDSPPLPLSDAPLTLSLGGRDSMFGVTVTPCPAALDKLTIPCDAKENECRLALLSPAKLPSDWRGRCAWALVSTRAIRGASTEDDRRLHLISQQYTYADSGSVFVFSDRATRDAFAERLRKDNLTVCGFNHCICY